MASTVSPKPARLASAVRLGADWLTNTAMASRERRAATRLPEEGRMTEAAAPERAVVRKVTWRLIPFLMLTYFFSMLDRTNIGVAALQMNADVGLSTAAYGLGGSLFFVAYFLFEVP